MTSRIDSLKSLGVSFKICNKTINGRKVDVANDLYGVDSEDIIPSGVAELSHLQAQGFSYIKP
jgi:intracellular sulfur oxidation DsrE/DsrF family protein